MKKRIVITGAGIFACNGKGKEEFWQSLKDGKAGYRPVTATFDPSQFRTKIAGEISDFDAAIYMGKKGLRLIDRSGRLILCAGTLCIDDSKFVITNENTDQVGVSTGSTLGSIRSIAEFDEITLKEGPRYVNPALFPNTVINAASSQISIWHNIQGFNSTMSTGFTASLDAMLYAYDLLQDGLVKMIYAGGVEEMCIQTFLGFHSLKFLSGSKPGEPFVNCPFDRRRNGITFGEGAAIVAMEDYEQAASRGAQIMAEIASFGSSFDPFRINKYNPRGTGLKRAMRLALAGAELEPQDIDYICANANSTVAADKIETEAIKEVFGEYAAKIPVSSIKSMTGECFSVSAAFAVVASLGAIVKDFIPPTINYQEKDPDCDLDYVPNQSRPAHLKNVLVVSFGPSGQNTCMVLRRFKK